MGFAFEILIIVGSLSVSHAYSWTSGSPYNGSLYFACLGDSITFPWAITMSSSERLINVQWYFTGDDGHAGVIATYVNGQFLPLSSSHRLSFVENVGIKISTLTQEDFGTYTAHVDISSGSSFLTEARYASLRVPESPRTSDGLLHARMLPNPIYRLGQWNIQLACGHFSSFGSSSFSVKWKTPSGRLLVSDSSANSDQILTLANPIEEGSYSCFIEVGEPAARCAYIIPSMVTSNQVVVETCSIKQALYSAVEQVNTNVLSAFQQVLMDRSGNSVRLVNGSWPWNGRVEVKYNNTWGTVCDDSFDERSAVVVCRMLGLSGHTPVVHGSAFYPLGTLPILLDDVVCRGNETNIFDCTHSTVGQHDCGHQEDVGVDCLPNFTLN